MTTESSVEARVFQEMVAALGSVDEANPIDLRARINARVEADTEAGAEIRDRAILAAAGEVDFEAVATGVVEAYTQYFGAVRTAGQALEVAFPGKADAAVSLLILAESGFRLGG